MNLKKMSKPNTKVTIDDILGPNINSNDTTILNDSKLLDNNFKLLDIASSTTINNDSSSNIITKKKNKNGDKNNNDKTNNDKPNNDKTNNDNNDKNNNDKNNNDKNNNDKNNNDKNTNTNNASGITSKKDAITTNIDNILNNGLVKFDNKVQTSMFFVDYKSIIVFCNEIKSTYNITIPKEFIDNHIITNIPIVIKEYTNNLKKRCKKIVDIEMICLGRKLDGKQCTRKKHIDSNFCKSHYNKLSNGRIDQPNNKVIKCNKRGRKRKVAFDPRQYDNEYITLWEDIIEGEKVLIDINNNMFTFDLESPQYIGKKEINSKLNIKDILMKIKTKKNLEANINITTLPEANINTTTIPETNINITTLPETNINTIPETITVPEKIDSNTTINSKIKLKKKVSKL